MPDWSKFPLIGRLVRSKQEKPNQPVSPENDASFLRNQPHKEAPWVTQAKTEGQEKTRQMMAEEGIRQLPYEPPKEEPSHEDLVAQEGIRQIREGPREVPKSMIGETHQQAFESYALQQTLNEARNRAKLDERPIPIGEAIPGFTTKQEETVQTIPLSQGESKE